MFSMSSPKASDSKRASRACIQLALPRTVLISPLWRCSARMGAVQLGKVLVLKRECTRASAVSISGLCRSVKYWSSCVVSSMPL